MKRILVAAFSLTLLSSAVLAAQPHSAAEDEDSIVPSTVPQKVDMRGGQLGNLPGALAGKRVISADQLQGAAGAGNVVIEQPSQKVGKFLPSNKTANSNTVQNGAIVVDEQPSQKTGKFLPSNKNANLSQAAGVPGGVVATDSLEDGGKKNYKNINQRSSEIMGDGF